MRQVENAHVWGEMAGATPLVKMLNAYLTVRFTVSRDVPADECLKEAMQVIAIVRAYGDSADSGAAWDALGREEFPTEETPQDKEPSK